MELISRRVVGIITITVKIELNPPIIGNPTYKTRWWDWVKSVVCRAYETLELWRVKEKAVGFWVIADTDTTQCLTHSFGSVLGTIFPTLDIREREKWH